MAIECPTGGQNVQVNVTGADGSGTICVRGSYTAFDRVAVLIRVRVLDDSPIDLGMAQPKQIKDVDVPGTAQWCAQNVWVPASSADGHALTAVAWVLTPDGSGGYTASLPWSVRFLGGGANPTDCCSGCGSSSGTIILAGELATAPTLHVTVPDGPNAGTHHAAVVDSLSWEVPVGEATYRIHALGRGDTLVLRNGSGSVESTAVAWEPFSAVFPGDLFGAAGEVVVTIA